MGERYTQIPLQHIDKSETARRLSLLDRYKQIPQAQRMIRYMDQEVSQRGFYYLENEDEYTVIDSQTVQAMKGGLFGMLTELQSDPTPHAAKEHILVEFGMRSKP